MNGAISTSLVLDVVLISRPGVRALHGVCQDNGEHDAYFNIREVTYEVTMYPQIHVVISGK